MVGQRLGMPTWKKSQQTKSTQVVEVNVCVCRGQGHDQSVVASLASDALREFF